MSGVNGKRAAAAGGLLYVASLVVVLVATRTSPEPKESAQKIVADLLEHRSEYAFAAYVAALQGPFLLLFAAGLGTTLAMGAAATAAALGLVGEGALAAAAYHGGLDAFALHTPLLLLGGLPLALLVLAAPPPRRQRLRLSGGRADSPEPCDFARLCASRDDTRSTLVANVRRAGSKDELPVLLRFRPQRPMNSVRDFRLPPLLRS
jgi:hypothetical protein